VQARLLAQASQRRERLPVRLDVSMVVDESVADRLPDFRARLAPLCDRVQFIPRLKHGPRTRACREPWRGTLVVLVDLALLALASGCGYTPLFGFPIEQGNIDAGRQAFIDHQCHRCHSVAGRRMPELAGAPPPQPGQRNPTVGRCCPS